MTTLYPDETLEGEIYNDNQTVEDVLADTPQTYLFVGVSPRGYRGCNYWYIDEEKQTLAGNYVWVAMGRHDTEQVVYVDSVRLCDKNTAPYPVDKARRVLRQATEADVAAAKEIWKTL